MPLTPMFSITDWVFFLVLDIGNASFSQLSVWRRMVNELLQVTTIRSAGFTAVPLTSLAPAVKLVTFKSSTYYTAHLFTRVMFVITMYIGACKSFQDLTEMLLIRNTKTLSH